MYNILTVTNYVPNTSAIIGNIIYCILRLDTVMIFLAVIVDVERVRVHKEGVTSQI